MIYIDLTQGAVTGYFSQSGIEASGRFYDAEIIKAETLEYYLDGSYSRIRAGAIEIARTALSAFTLTNRVFDIAVYLEKTGTLLFSGKAVLVNITQTAAVFKLKTDQEPVDLLVAAPDLNAGTYDQGRVYPRAFGSVVRVEPLCLDDTTYTYHSASGTVSTVYDDGASVAFTPGSGTFTLSAEPTGTVTADIATTETTFIAVIEALAALLGLTVDHAHADATVQINDFVNTQTDVISQICVYCDWHDHIYWIDWTASKLYLIDKIQNTGTLTRDGFVTLLDGANLEEVEIIRSFEATWTSRIEQGTPQQTIEYEETASVSTGFDCGSITSLTAPDNDRARIITALTKKKTLYADYQNMTLDASIESSGGFDTAVSPGKEIDFDGKWIAGDLLVQGYAFDFSNGKTTYTGLAHNLTFD